MSSLELGLLGWVGQGVRVKGFGSGRGFEVGGVGVDNRKEPSIAMLHVGYNFQVMGKMVPLLQNSNYSNHKLCPNKVNFPVTVV